MNCNIPFINPTFPSSADVLEDYEKIHQNNYYSNNGEFYYEFKELVEKYLGNNSSVAIVANATIGIVMALATALDKQKKYVLVPSFTFAAGPLAILWAGFEPLFIDIEESTMQPSLIQARELLEKEKDSIAGVLLCNSFGIGNLSINGWEDLTNELDVPLIIDSAAGFGSTYGDDELVGSRGLCEVFSLHATKPFGIGEGGIIASCNEKFIASMEIFKNFGFNQSRESEVRGINAKIPELSCALGVRMLSGLDARIKRRQEIFCSYRDDAKNFGISFIENAESSSLCFASLLLPPEWSKVALLKMYSEVGIEVRDYYNPVVHLHPQFRNFRKCDLKVTEDTSSRLISLPISEKLTDQDIENVMKVLHNYAEQ